LQNLNTIFAMLDMYGVSAYVNVDLGLIRDYDYYTGMVFEVYTSGLGFPICGGGRYDNLVEKFGSGVPATGFAIGVERALLALQRQGYAFPVQPERYAVVYAEGCEMQAVEKARELREAGFIVELEMKGDRAAELQTYIAKPGITKVVKVTG
jgi:ATP phosphoribosyltransferase regulatory subunit